MAKDSEFIQNFVDINEYTIQLNRSSNLLESKK